MKKIILYSGGLDSYCLFRIMLHKGYEDDIVLFYIDSDTPLAKLEREVVAQTALQYNVGFKITPKQYIQYYAQSDGFIPLRNLLFSMLPVMDGADIVLLAAVQGEESLDKSKKFFRDTSKLFSYLLHRKVLIGAPTIGMTKTELVAEVLKIGVLPEELMSTVSCYLGEKYRVHGYAGCGSCQACVRRYIAMEANDIQEYYPIDMIKQVGFMIGAVKPVKRLFKQPVSRWPHIIKNNYELLRTYLQIKGKKYH